jgi:flavin-dependent dehydrogenase
MKYDADVLVLGAGPAGASLAVRLARLGWSVLLVDKSAFPRPKPCGEFLSPECLPHLREVGVEGLLQAGKAWNVHGMRLHRRDVRAVGRFCATSSAVPVQGLGIGRDVLDHSLFEAACGQRDVEALSRHSFQYLLRDSSGRIQGARVRTPQRDERDLRARLVVAADGVRSRVAKQLGIQRRIGWLDKSALVTRFEGVPACETAEIHFLPGGYFAATHVDDGVLHLNLVVDTPLLRTRQGTRDDFLQTQLQHAPALAGRLAPGRRAAPWSGCGPLAYTTTRQALPGVALLGDACGYVDPMTGEGIYFALLGSSLLAQAADTALRSPKREAAALADYCRRRKQEIGPRLMMARWLQHGIRHPWLVDRFLQLLAEFPRLCDALVTLTGDTIHPRDLLRPSFWQQLRTVEATA